VRKAIETMTGLRVVRVDVHVQGVSFEKENKALEKGMQSAALASGESFKQIPEKKDTAREEAPVPPATVELTEDEDEVDRDIEEPEDEAADPEDPEDAGDEAPVEEAPAAEPAAEVQEVQQEQEEKKE